MTRHERIHLGNTPSGIARASSQEAENRLWANIAVLVGTDDKSAHQLLLDGTTEMKCRKLQQELQEELSELDKKARACKRTPKKSLSAYERLKVDRMLRDIESIRERKHEALRRASSVLNEVPLYLLRLALTERPHPAFVAAFLAGGLEKRSERLTADLEKEITYLNNQFRAAARAVRCSPTRDERLARQDEVARLKKERNAKQELLCDTWDDIRRLREWFIHAVREQMYQQGSPSSSHHAEM